ncbi:Mg/Co/Ni transporter MgtE / CBS domain protein [Enhygromyxa salina]|uniref:Magnesium transporter MgtE n=1 Tax=Enhygromyxa salina TaxID=215803 RepID=A0A0C2CZQ5_9BACT|nr:magnesium transporter [Enhygromyxa salina]KIG13352.1 Mg/Co/Ni transporter MgtE / CBS domain protein [Enhygromyxa salina]
MARRKQIDLMRPLRRKETRRVARILQRLDEVQIAAQLDNAPPEDQDRVLQMLSVERRAAVFAELREETAAEIVRRLAPEEVAILLDDLDSDDVADILGRVEESLLRQILTRLDPEDADEVEQLLGYDENSAGGIMSLDFIRVYDSATVAEATRVVQEVEDPPDQAFYVYVIDEDDRLVGVVSLRKLLTGRRDDSIREVMEPELVYVDRESDQEDVADVAMRYDLVAVPVVDEQRRLVGVVTIDDIVDVIREEATEDILKMAGAGEELFETRSFWSSFRARMPWLLAAAIGGVLVAVALSGFESALEAVPVLALFMPVVAGMGGNVGTQSSTIVVRGLAVGYVESGALGRLVFREMGLGLTLGALYGLLIALAAPFVGTSVADPVALGIVLMAGMMGSMTIAATVGTSIPLLMNRLKIDPAVSTGPFVTTAVDILGLMFYFWLATVLLDVPM